MEDKQHIVVLFDGVCSFCSRTVQFLLRHDHRRCLFFAALQSPQGKALLAQHGLSQLGTREDNGSLVVLDGSRSYLRSDAALYLARTLGGAFWIVALLGQCLPRFLRDAGYRAFAKRRYRWFGRTQQCAVPSREHRGRFLDEL